MTVHSKVSNSGTENEEWKIVYAALWSSWGSDNCALWVWGHGLVAWLEAK